jgi:hypothetical protein
MLMLIVGTGLVATTALVLSSRLADGSVTQWLLGAYVIGFAGIVLVSLLLSTASSLSRWPLFGSLLAVLCLAIIVARPFRPPPWRAAFRSLAPVLCDPPVAVVAIVVLGVIAYSFALGLFTPPNDQDALGYHLARAAFWAQQEAVGRVPAAGDTRLNEFAPNGEIAMAFTMVASGTGRFASLVELTAALAAALGVFGLARRLGLSLRDSLFSALLLLTLPAIALQMSTGLNDVVVASLVAASAFFLLRGTWCNLALAGITISVLVGTKLTGILALPGLAVVALAARRHRPLVALPVLGLCVIVGGYWYAFNLAEGRDPFGGIGGERVKLDAVAAAARVVRLGLDSIELPGAIGLDRLLYLGAALLLTVLALVGSDSLQTRMRRAGIASAATLAPLLLLPVGRLLVRASQKFFFEIGRSDVGYLDSGRSLTKASPIFSWYGPLGFLLTLLSFALVVREVRRRKLPRVALALAAAPAIWIVLLGVGVPYWEWNGRYVMGGFVLGAATWSVALRARPLAWAVAAIASLTVTLSFVHLHDRPSGLRLIEPTHETSVWSEPSWSVQATDHPDERAVFRFVDRHIPSNARLALEPVVWPVREHVQGEMLAYPFFGRDLSRKVFLADSIERAGAVQADWAILRDDGIPSCVPGWPRVFRHDVWIILKRAPGFGCM